MFVKQVRKGIFWLLVLGLFAGYCPVQAQFFGSPSSFLKDGRSKPKGMASKKARKRNKKLRKKAKNYERNHVRLKTGQKSKPSNFNKSKPNYQKKNFSVSKSHSFSKYKKRSKLKMSKRKSLYMKKKAKNNPYNKKGRRKSALKSKFGRKVSVGGFIGTLISDKNADLNAAGISQNIFSGYSPGYVLGGFITYNVTKNLAIGARLRYFYMKNSVYALNDVTLGLDLKYNLLPSDKKFSPYVFGEFNMSLLGIDRAGSTTSTKPDPSYSVIDGNSIPVNQIDYTEPERKVSFIPVFGYSVGIGTDIRFLETFGIFVQAEYSSNFTAQNSLVINNFNNNTANFNYVFLSMGVKINAFKSKRLY